MFKVQYKFKDQKWRDVLLHSFRDQHDAEVAMRLLGESDELRDVKMRVVEARRIPLVKPSKSKRAK